MLHLNLPEEEWQDKHKSHTREEIIRPDKKFMQCRTRKQFKELMNQRDDSLK